MWIERERERERGGYFSWLIPTSLKLILHSTSFSCFCYLVLVLSFHHQFQFHISPFLPLWRIPSSPFTTHGKQVYAPITIYTRVYTYTRAPFAFNVASVCSTLPKFFFFFPFFLYFLFLLLILLPRVSACTTGRLFFPIKRHNSAILLER